MTEPKRYKWEVCVTSWTYNHAPYIVDTMNGFCMQETDFPFVCTIVDDCSTDGEPEVIRRYLEENFKYRDGSEVNNVETDDYLLTFAQHKTNSNCFFAVFFLKYNHYQVKKNKLPYLKEWRESANYLAICEGDDYWIYPQKLQMQVDFLNNNPDYTLVHTDFDLVEGKRHHWKEIFPDGNYFPGIFHNNVNIGTLTTLFRFSTYASLQHSYIGKGWPMGDYPLWIEFSHAAKIKYFNLVTAKYRILQKSASHSSDINQLIKFKNVGVEVRHFYVNLYNVQLAHGGLSKKYYIDIMRYAYRLKDKKTAKVYFKKALQNRLLTYKTIIYFLGVFSSLLRRVIGEH